VFLTITNILVKGSFINLLAGLSGVLYAFFAGERQTICFVFGLVYNLSYAYVAYQWKLNADVILSIGSRLNIRQVGYSFWEWAPKACVMQNDIDLEEIAKPSVHCDLPLHGDAKALLEALLHLLKQEEKLPLFAGGKGISREKAKGFVREDAAEKILAEKQDEKLSWLDTIRFYQANYPTVLPEYLEERKGELTNVYALVEKLSERASEDQITVVGNGSPF